MLSKFRVAALDQRELYVTDNFYCYQRGDKFVVALTNTGTGGGQLHYVVKTSFTPNLLVCNIFWGESDCMTVKSDGSLDIYLNNGESKVFVAWYDL